MKNFNLERLKNYARYDLTVNAKQYRNFALIYVVIMAVVTLLYINEGWQTVINPINDEFCRTYWDSRVGADIFLWLSSLFILLAATYINIPLRGKQSRIRMLTTPADNCEKFAWHTSVSTLGAVAVAAVALIVCEVINLTIGTMLLGSEHIGSYVGRVIELAGDFFSPESYTRERIMEHIWPMGLYIFTFSFIALVSLYRWRYSMLWSLMFMFGIGIAGLIVLQSVLRSGSLYEYLMWLDGDPSHPDIIVWVLSIVGLVLTAGMWTLSYRRFRRIQVVDKLNKR